MFHNFWLLSSLLWISQLMVSCFGIGANFLRWPQQCWGKWWRSGCGAEKMSALFELQQLDLKPLPLLPPPCQCTFWTATAKPCTPPSLPCPSPSLWTIFNCVGSLNSRFMLLAAHFGLKLQDPVLLHLISVVHLYILLHWLSVYSKLLKPKSDIRCYQHWDPLHTLTHWLKYNPVSCALMHCGWWMHSSGK